MNALPGVFPEPDGSFAGSWLLRRRTQALLTPERLATLAGVQARTIRDIESGRIPRPPAEIIRLLLDTLETADTTVITRIEH